MRMMIVKGITRRPNSDTAILILCTEAADLRLDLVIPPEEAVRLRRLFAAVGCRCTPIYESLLILAEHLETSVARAMLDAAGDKIKAALNLPMRDASSPSNVIPATPSPWRCGRTPRSTPP